MTAMQSYPAYKDSGVEWLGDVPEHWQVGRASSRLRVRNRPIHPREISRSELFHYSIPNVQQYGSGRREETSSVESGKILVDRELLLISKLNPRKGTIALAFPHPTLMTVASGEFVAMEPSACLGVFARYVYGSESVRLELSSRVNSATKSHQRCTPEDIAKLRVPWPPTEEQTAIVRFLGDADRRIRRYIRAKERLIELLEEERQATIHEAVTGRIDVRTGHPYPAYKDSGVEWLGQVPEHWEVRSLGTFGRFFKGSGGTKADETAKGVSCVRYGDLYTRHQFRITESRACVAPNRAGAYTPVRYGDVLFAGSGETLEEIGKSAVNLIRGSAVCGGDVIVFRPTIDVDAEFMGWSTDCRRAASQKARMGRGITVMHIYSSDLKYLAVLLPPLTEQTAIARFLAAAERRLSARRATVARQIDLLREYRTRLIADVVTGKLDVREAAAKLPETDPRAGDRNRPGTIPIEPNPHASEHDMAREARA